MNDANVWRTAPSRGKPPRRQQQQQNKATDIRQNGVSHGNGFPAAAAATKSMYKDAADRGLNGNSENNGGFVSKNQPQVRRNLARDQQKTVPVANGFSGGDPKKSLEKEIKSLLKHEAAVERSRWLFNEEMTKSEDRLRRAFKELRELLDQREAKLLTELELCKTEGLLLLDNSAQSGREFKAQTERAAKMTDRELGEVRQNVRKLASDERRLDDLGRTLRFQYEPDKLIDLINGFGDVTPVSGTPAKASSVNSLISADSADASIASSDIGKSVNQVMIGGLLIQSDSMDTSQLADLTRQLQESLKMRGITDDIIPEVTGSSGSMPQRRRPPPTAPPTSQMANGRRSAGRR